MYLFPHSMSVLKSRARCQGQRVTKRHSYPDSGPSDTHREMRTPLGLSLNFWGSLATMCVTEAKPKIQRQFMTSFLRDVDKDAMLLSQCKGPCLSGSMSILWPGKLASDRPNSDSHGIAMGKKGEKIACVLVMGRMEFGIRSTRRARKMPRRCRSSHSKGLTRLRKGVVVSLNFVV